MPYKIEKSGSGYKVAKKNGGKTFSKKPISHDKAIAQLRAIQMNSQNEGTRSKINLDAIMESMLDSES